MQSQQELCASSQQRALVAVATFAVAWIIARACIQSITIDEADTYMEFVAGAEPRYWNNHWAARPNNHLLNSMLMRLFVSLFGLHHVTVRAPAIIGAVLYTWASYLIVVLITSEQFLQLFLLVCLVFNPFVMDYLVAARGYSLASGLLLMSIYLAFRAIDKGASEQARLRITMLTSLCAGLSFCANFAFAIVVLSLMLVLYIQEFCFLRTAPNLGSRILSALRLTGASILPGTVIAFYLSASVLMNWTKDNLVYGSRSLRHTAASVIDASLFEPSPFLVGPFFYPAVLRFSSYLPVALGLAFVLHLLIMIVLKLVRAFRRSSFVMTSMDSGDASVSAIAPPFPDPTSADANRKRALVIAIVGILTILIHRLMYALSRILMPLDRTAVYLAPLIVLLMGSVAAIQAGWRLDRSSRRILISMLGLLAVYFILCLRLSYFKEWKYNAGVCDAYSVIARYNHTYIFEDVVSNFRYVAALNFYRIQSGHEHLNEIPAGPIEIGEYPGASKLVYVVVFPLDIAFVKREGLKIVHQDPTGLVIAIRPELEDRVRPLHSDN